VKVQVELGQKYFYPDLVVTCDDRDRNPQLIQLPCLIIEVLSPSTEAIDRGKKFPAYRQSATLQEYILIQVTQPSVEVLRRNEQGKWVLSANTFVNLSRFLPSSGICSTSNSY